MSCFRFIAAEKTDYSISLMCRVLGVSRSGLHAWEQRAPSERALVDARLSERIREMDARSRDSYGARRVYLDLRDEDVRVGRKRVERGDARRGPVGLREAADVPHDLRRAGRQGR